MGIKLKEGDVVLFQGDSITDAGRRDDEAGLGRGYAFLTAAYFLGTRPELSLSFLNRGISGDRSKDLLSRWEEDCLSLKPDVLSLLIGVNNTWRRYDADDPTPANVFKKEYETILKQSTDATDAALVICEPFLLHVNDEVKKMREDLDPKREICRELAEKYKTVFVPFDSLFQDACNRTEPSYWSADGVHPTIAGHAFMANEWIKAVIG